MIIISEMMSILCLLGPPVPLDQFPEVEMAEIEDFSWRRSNFEITH